MPEEILISFCTACMNRQDHLRQTLVANLRDNQNITGVEFLLVDYGSTDGLGRWINNEMVPNLESGRLVYIKTKSFEFFHHAHAKNIAHRAARGRIVCNLDADNYTGIGFSEYLIQIFLSDDKLIVIPPTKNKGKRGTFGRIAMLKSDFELIGGYDEQMRFGWGYEDRDLINRAARMGIKIHFMPDNPSFLNAIQHGMNERAAHNRIKNCTRSRNRHRRISLKNIEDGKLVANDGRPWGVFT